MAGESREGGDGPLVPNPSSAFPSMSRWVRLSFGFVAILLTLAFPLAALAEGETIAGTLVSRAGGERTPVEGVAISVSQDGTQIGTAVSDAQGRWEVPLPGPGTYKVTLDVATPPEGVTLTDPNKVELPDVAVIGGQRKSVIFPLGEGGLALSKPKLLERRLSAGSAVGGGFDVIDAADVPDHRASPP